MRRLRPYLAYFSRAFSSHLAYAGSIWLNLAAASLNFCLTLLVWRFVRAGGGGPGEQAPLFAYLALAFAWNFSLGLVLERHVGERIREGLIAVDLLKPVDMPGLFLAQSLSDIAFQAFFGLAALGLAWTWLGPALGPASGLAAALTPLALLLGALLHFQVSFLFVQMIFLTHSNYGPSITRMVLHNALSGVFAPLALYPEGLRRAAELLPFRHIVHTPLALWQGRIPPEGAWGALGAQALWVLGLGLLARFSFDRLRRSLSIQGG